MPLKLSNSDVTFIQQLPVSRIATSTKNGNPRVRPIWHVFDGTHIYFATDPGTIKLRHLEENSKVSIVFDDYDRADWSNLRGIRIQGNAKILNGGKNYRRAHSLLKEKYPEYRTKEGGWEEGEIPIIKITPKDFGKWADGKWKHPNRQIPNHDSVDIPPT
jgi:nitroimidazol reductase NimA-like FMN-containing flavoprotein (pyridoxamine 5'-phosphate oxidase superfamily)